jgi:hypothetical protein
MKRLLVLEGPGFYESSDLKVPLSSRNWEMVTMNLESPGAVPNISQVDAVLLRGAWAGSPEEKIWTRLLAAKMEPLLSMLLSRLQSQKNAPKILGIGRGAMILLASKVLGLIDYDTCQWKSLDLHLQPWIETVVSPISGPVLSQVLGRIGPILEPKKSLVHTEWVLAKKQNGTNDILGWAFFEGAVKISLVDILAFSDRSQSPDFGYRELHNYKSKAENLLTLLES